MKTTLSIALLGFGIYLCTRGDEFMFYAGAIFNTVSVIYLLRTYLFNSAVACRYGLHDFEDADHYDQLYNNINMRCRHCYKGVKCGGKLEDRG